MKCTVIAPSNIAFIKYWGRKDEALKLPSNGSISMNLSELTTTTTVEFDSSLRDDDVVINGTVEKNGTKEKVSSHLDRVRALAGISERAKVVSENSFPRGTGLSSSASGFAALTLAATKAAGLDLSEKELSILARQGSGSACRSIPDGFVEWRDGDTSEMSYATSIYPPDYWDIIDIAVILTDQVKDVSTTEGQKLAASSPFFRVRQDLIKEKIVRIKKSLEEKDFKIFGEITESEALEMHAIMLTSHPSLIYWYPATITIMKAVQRWRSEGLACYFTMNTGQNIHILCEKSTEKILSEKLREISVVKQIIASNASKGAHLLDTHLF
ncbi:MAG: diphosphomevalonate decarboxylase, diphosphomevalonate decarboxylase [Candidatus Parcubacteria bacterium]|jgi:diphosphomevalonate decarboxylase